MLGLLRDGGIFDDSLARRIFPGGIGTDHDQTADWVRSAPAHPLPPPVCTGGLVLSRLPDRA